MEYTRALANLIEEFQKFPGVGPKSAQRMAFSLLKRSSEQIEKYTNAIKDAKDNISYCQNCFNLTSHKQDDKPLCEICLSTKRDANQICIVEEVKDLIALERTKEYSGHYHVLGGVISPLDGISSDDLNIKALLKRLQEKLRENSLSQNSDPVELILALNLSTEGEATILYLKRSIEELVKAFKLEPGSEIIKITRLAYGLPVGADLDYTDEGTLAKALEARVLC